MAAGALILNDQDEILIVKPSYKDHWSIAGGFVEADESPREACLREVKEEIGLDLREIKFLAVDYLLKEGEKSESLQFIFFGGKLNKNEIDNIKLDGKEIVEYKFVKVNQALPLLSDKLRKRLPECLAALKNNVAVYLENGK